MTLQRKSLGLKGEELAAQLLLKKGYRIVERNFRCRLGEIDIVARQGDCIVFVEVRTKSNVECGQPQESITFRKIRKLRRLAEWYLVQRKIEGLNVRFDVIAVVCAGQTVVKHIKNAF